MAHGSAAPHQCSATWVTGPAFSREASVEQELRLKLDIVIGCAATAAILRTRLALDSQNGWGMSAADRRLAELLERWMTSVDMHARYLALDDSAYAKVQDWPKHQRPTRWVVGLARTRLLELKRIADERRSQGDAAFAEALELMAFLTNLLGSEHVDRFIPLAQPKAETPAPSPAPVPAPKPARRNEQRTESRPAAAARPARSSSAAPRRATTPSPKPASVVDEPTASSPATATVIADAVRLISWGREWPQLAGLIARLANRPPEAEVWKILRKHRAEIETQARRPRD